MPTPSGHETPRNPYRNLVLLSHLTLSGSGPASGLLERAHLLVVGALPRGRRHPRPHEYAKVRRRVLRRSLYPRRWHPRGEAGLSVIPAAGLGAESRDLDGLSGLGPAERAAYALLYVEGLDPRAAAEVLASAGADASERAVERAAQAPADAHLPDPTLVRVSGRGALVQRRHFVVVGVVGAVLLLGAGLTAADPVTDTGGPEAALPQTAHAETDPVWDERFTLDLTAWHARGEAAGDEGFTGRALDAWAERSVQEGSVAAPSEPSVLYAGQVDGSDVVLLHDAPYLARWVEDEDGQESLGVFDAPENGVANWPALRLTENGDGVRYLLPPWVEEASTARFDEPGQGWNDLEHDEKGVTAAAPDPEQCEAGPVLQLRAPEVAHGEPYTAVDMGGPGTAHLGYMPPPPEEIRRLGPHEVLDTEHGFDLWADLACSGAPPEGQISTATAWEFAEQELPGGEGTGRWTCVRYGTRDGSGLARAVLVTEGGDGSARTTVAGERENGWDCSNLNRQIVAGTWWQDTDDAWHYLAAASREAAEITARGEVSGSEEDTTLAVEGPASGEQPSGGVEVSAVDGRSEEMTAFDGLP
ncbi:hypothetical protein IDM40_17595 [Nocardiopsis sp. HNM0947]|uniref:Uncharacterized protein n=1 Tax=Nocardiopsis coralli TaxID=2772213 RepID=A0ABR9P9J7_9ACTN|nr:hypothetical protein [Nocardiopsis coralli]MBE3000502.1 hypothetical protein [Nocardiopsis coralli]